MTAEHPEVLAGTIAIVTGGGRGLGRAIALGLVAAGARVAITASRSRDELDAVVAAAPAGRMIALVGDVSSNDDCVRIVAEATRRLGPIDILVNNAGRGMRFVSETFMTEPTRFWETDVATWRMVIDTNVNGPFQMARAVAPGMIARGHGRIINVSMNHATMRRRGFSPYGPSKAALESETIIWAQDLEGTGVTVNAVTPGGATRTGMVPEDVPDSVAKILLDPAIIVAPVTWLASAAAAGVTGKRYNAALWTPGNPASAEETAGWAP